MIPMICNYQLRPTIHVCFCQSYLLVLLTFKFFFFSSPFITHLLLFLLSAWSFGFGLIPHLFHFPSSRLSFQDCTFLLFFSLAASVCDISTYIFTAARTHDNNDNLPWVLPPDFFNTLSWGNDKQNRYKNNKKKIYKIYEGVCNSSQNTYKIYPLHRHISK